MPKIKIKNLTPNERAWIDAHSGNSKFSLYDAVGTHLNAKGVNYLKSVLSNTYRIKTKEKKLNNGFRLLEKEYRLYPQLAEVWLNDKIVASGTLEVLTWLRGL